MSDKIPVLLAHETIVLILKMLNETPMPMRVARPIYDDLQQQVTVALLQRRGAELAMAKPTNPPEAVVIEPNPPRPANGEACPAGDL
jgi:hypothetical protein